MIVGSPVEVVDELLAWVADTDVDGFNLVRTVMPESLGLIVDLVVPELQNPRAFKTAYGEGTLWEKLFPAGRPGLARRMEPPAIARAPRAGRGGGMASRHSRVRARAHRGP